MLFEHPVYRSYRERDRIQTRLTSRLVDILNRALLKVHPDARTHIENGNVIITRAGSAEDFPRGQRYTKIASPTPILTKQ